MSVQTSGELAGKRCVPCEGGVKPYSRQDAEAQLAALEGWRLSEDGKRIRREWEVKDFLSGLAFFEEVGRIAEAEGHHPDLHLAWGRVRMEIWTHSIDGLSVSDFVFSAKAERLYQP